MSISPFLFPWGFRKGRIIGRRKGVGGWRPLPKQPPLDDSKDIESQPVHRFIRNVSLPVFALDFFALELASLRRKKGLTRSEMAQRVRMSTIHYRHLEVGEEILPDPHWKKVLILARKA